VRALHEAADDMGRAETFKGYGPYVGYEWLREAIARHDFGPREQTQEAIDRLRSRLG